MSLVAMVPMLLALVIHVAAASVITDPGDVHGNESFAESYTMKNTTLAFDRVTHGYTESESETQRTNSEESAFLMSTEVPFNNLSRPEMRGDGTSPQGNSTVIGVYIAEHTAIVDGQTMIVSTLNPEDIQPESTEPDVGTDTTPKSVEETVPEWSRIFDLCQLTCTSVGFVANVVTLVTLIASQKGFSRLILSLFRHQALVDAWVCAMASVVMLQPYHWLTGNLYVDIVVCHVWHGQAFYWGAVTLSTYNLVLISFERFLAVCTPFKHAQWQAISRKTFAYVILALYILVLFITHGTYIQTRFVDGQCRHEYAFDGEGMEIYFSAFVIFTYVTTYLIPAIIMAILYGAVSYRLHKRSNDVDLGQSKVVDRAGAQLTKTAIVVTMIFIVSIGYDLHYYLLGHTGVLVYELNTPTQKVGVFLSNLNSSLNPFVYTALMPIFRVSLASTFCCTDLRLRHRDNSEDFSSSFTSRTAPAPLNASLNASMATIATVSSDVSKNTNL